MDSQLDRLDEIANHVARDRFAAYGPLSTGERLYVAIAASRSEILEEEGYTIAEALARIGPAWRGELLRRWQYVSHRQLRADPDQ